MNYNKENNSLSTRRHRHKFKRLCAATMIAVSATFAVTGCSNGSEDTVNAAQSSKTVVTIGYLPITHSLAVLKEKELLEQNNSDIEIKLQRFNSWPDLMDALNSGKIDGASALIELAMNAKSNGIGLKAAALGHRDGNVVVVSNKINSVEDLKGKTFAIPSIQSSQNILVRELLEKNGVGRDEVNIIQLSPTEMPFSLASGAISGYCVAEPYGAVSISKEFGKVLATSEELWSDSLCCALVFNDSFLESNKEAADELIKGYYEASQGLDKHSTKEVASEYLGQEDTVLTQSIEWINYNNLSISKEEYDDLCNKLVKYRINEHPPSYEEFIYRE